MPSIKAFAPTLLTFVFSITTATAIAQSLPSGGVLLQGLGGMRPYMHTAQCTPQMADNRVLCVIGYGESAEVTFTNQKSATDGCTFRVSNNGKSGEGDLFNISRIRNSFTRPCSVQNKSNRHFLIRPI
jgi:hypothetical protein